MVDGASVSTRYRERENRIQYVTFALAAFGFMAPQGHAGATFGLLLLVGFALTEWRRFVRDVYRDGLFVVWSILSVYIMIRAIGAAIEFPATSHEQWEIAFRLARTGFFVILVSWCLAADTKRVMWLMGAALAGFCIEVLVELDPGAFERILRGGERNMLGAALPIGLAGAIAIVGLFVFLPRSIRLASQQRQIVRFSLYAAIAIGASLLGLVQIITQSRAVFGMLAILLPIIVAWHFLGRAGGTHGRTSLTVTYGVVIGLIAVALMLIGPRLVDKLENDYSRVAPYISSGGLEDMPESSLGWRIHLNVHGSDLWAKRPWIGWGPGTSSTRDLSDGYQLVDLSTRNHLHNTYLEIVVRLGLVGATLYLFAIGVLLRHAIRARPGKGLMPDDVGMFVVAGSALMAGWSLIDFHLINWDFIIPLVLLAAIVHTYATRWNRGGHARA